MKKRTAKSQRYSLKNIKGDDGNKKTVSSEPFDCRFKPGWERKKEGAQGQNSTKQVSPLLCREFKG